MNDRSNSNSNGGGLLAKLRCALTFGRGVARGLPELEAGTTPIALFHEWFDQARRAGILLPEAMAVATCTKDGAPSARMMLLKGADERGFVFFTNHVSRKGSELATNPRAALVFHWSVLQRQVRVEGDVEKLSEQASKEYFHSRPRGSQISAWASPQSSPVPSRTALEDQVRQYEKQFDGAEVPLPPFWGGLLLVPQRIEFWQGRPNRLHDRLCCTRQEDGWEVERLAP